MRVGIGRLKGSRVPRCNPMTGVNSENQGLSGGFSSGSVVQNE